MHRNYLHEAAVFLRPLTSLTILNIWHQDLTLTGAADYPLDCILNGILDLEQLEKLALCTYYVNKDNVLRFQNTSVKYLELKNLKEIEQSAFSTWSGLNSLVLEYDKNVGIPPGQLFQNLSGIYVQRLYVKGKMYGDVYFHGFEAPNLLALAIYKSDVDMFDFGSLTAKNTVEWLDISGNKLVTIDTVEKIPKLLYLNVNSQTSDVCMENGNGTSGRRFPDNLDFIDLSDTLLCNIPKLGNIPFKVVNLSHSCCIIGRNGHALQNRILASFRLVIKSY